MQGILLKQKNGYNHLQVGYADKRFLVVMIPLPLSVLLFLAVRIYREIPATEWRLLHFLTLYTVASLLYLNAGVWLHEQLHCLAFRNSQYAKRIQIVYERKCLLVLRGYYRVGGVMDYRIMRRALLGPALLVIGLLAIGWLGSWMLPGWWFAIMASMAMAAVLDMSHDIYMLLQIWPVGDKGKYWDRGHHMEVVWKQE